MNLPSKVILTFLFINLNSLAICQSVFNFNPAFGSKYHLLGNQNYSKTNNSALDFANNSSLITSDSLLKIGISTLRISSINAFSLAISKSIKAGNVVLAIQSIPFGKMQEYSTIGLNTGQFNASVNSFLAGYSYHLGLFSFGVSSRLNIASIQNFQNLHLGLNFNGMYENSKKGIGIGWNIENISIIKKQGLQNYNYLPQVSFGFSLRPKYIPIKLHASAFNLIEKKYKKNFAFGLEILENKPFSLILGYNNSAINQFRTGFRLNKNRFSFLIGTEIGPLNTQFFELNYFIKRK